ncbi:hypothetical protein R6Q57_014691 [Mikania cordata]
MVPKPSKTSKSSTSSSSNSLLLVSTHEINWMPSDFEGFLKEFRIFPEWHPELPSLGSAALDVHSGKIWLYVDIFRFSHFQLPISKFFLHILERYGLHISQMIPLGLIHLYQYEFVLRSARAAVIPLYFQIFFKLVKKDDWYSFDKRGGPSMVLKVPSSSRDKNWRNKFFFIDEKVIPSRMRWRSSTDPIIDLAPTDNPGYFFDVLLDNRRGLLVPEERPLKAQEMPFMQFTARYFAFPSDGDTTGHVVVEDTGEQEQILFLMPLRSLRVIAHPRVLSQLLRW